MGKRPKRQVILFLVEGDSERLALKNRIAEFYDAIDESIEVFFPEIFLPANDPSDPSAKIETGGDITQRYDVYPGNYDDKVYEYFLRDFFDIEHLLPKDVTRVIQLVDMDGAYIDDSLVTECDNPSSDFKPIYGDNSIICKRSSSLIGRHKRKQLNLDYLKTKNSIKIKTKTVPFSTYFFSCNLDHFIHNTANLEGREKTTWAEAFSSGFIGNPDGFAQFFITDPDSMHGKTYAESWEFITELGTLASLHRHTNIDILLEELLDK